MSPYVYESFVKSAAGGVVQNLNVKKVRDLIIPIPPLAEQSRITTKIDELIALCDELKSLIHKSSIKQNHIADVLVSKVLNSKEV
tara:strand:+ start:106 stop:360 length:255 start_codon:yes stop_codon:yes gene_type:complete